MAQFDQLEKRLKNYAHREQLIDIVSHLLFVLTTTLISTTVSILLLKSPFYGLIGIIPLFFYRNIPFIERVKTLEKRINLSDKLINSIQLSKISLDNKERYSRELINAYIETVAEAIKNIDLKKYIDLKTLKRNLLLFLIAVAVTLIPPAFFPEYFWYALTHKIDYTISPGDMILLKDSPVVLSIKLWGVYLPGDVWLLIYQGGKLQKEKISLKDGQGEKKIKITEETSYQFQFLDQKTRRFRLKVKEPIFIENLQFHLHYPPYTKLKTETKTGRQLIVPQFTRVEIEGRASQDLSTAVLEFIDTLNLSIEGKTFHGSFTVKKSGVAYLHLKSHSSLKEPLRIYSIPDLAPMVSIFYPGYNINLPQDMKLKIGIRCSDDYGLKSANFYYTYRKESRRVLKIHSGAIEDTIFFEWDLSQLALLPGDEVSYYAIIGDNAGHYSKSKVYYVYFPTMEQIYKEVSKKENEVSKDLEFLRSLHGEEMKEMDRLHKKLMEERKITWAEQEKLKQIIEREKRITEKIDAWQAELEKTIEKLNEGIVLDRKSIERLKEITDILQELAPEKLRQALNQLKQTLNQRPEDIEKALQNIKEHQKELAEALKRTLELLRRFQQEERLKELAEKARKLADEQKTIEELLKNDSLKAEKEQLQVDQDIKELSNELQELARSQGLEAEIKQALEMMSEQTQAMIQMDAHSKKEALENLAMDLEKLYKKLTRSRRANLRKNLIAVLNQIIAASKQEERLLKEDLPEKKRFQQEILQATRTIADSLYAQQTKSLYVSPQIGKRLARAMLKMKQAQKLFSKRNQGKPAVRQAMAELNVVAFQLLQSLKNASAGKSSTGMDKFLQTLSNISKGQMSLNQSLMNILPIPASGLNAQQRAQLRSLARKQGELRQALESLKNEPGAGEYGDIIEGLTKEMREMEEQLYQYKVDRELIERQRRLITRLLDAQRSIRKEDYTKKRISRPGQNFLERTSPKPLSEHISKDELREMIQRALRESYPTEYELYIREYFKKLLEQR
ncbi:hypothetical protein BXT86_01745 [candidate division WOR-3 bacterium 4484_100]|uniref:DUF4175 domain-containing protein n=1 Tax=candidate division WOR-3 bacterium 4484_100 TaxID=1936077 RepID=A0A1V4QG59_UNCW3|nr:MAG: hypothetical protein BXT86_01745 [candidate division WOR-3 bacterium 4484_100]